MLSHPDRVETLYFIFAVVLRAVIKAMNLNLVAAVSGGMERNYYWVLDMPLPRP